MSPESSVNTLPTGDRTGDRCRFFQQRKSPHAIKPKTLTKKGAFRYWREREVDTQPRAMRSRCIDR